MSSDEVLSSYGKDHLRQLIAARRRELDNEPPNSRARRSMEREIAAIEAELHRRRQG
jgi:hypothetical protein